MVEENTLLKESNAIVFHNLHYLGYGHDYDETHRKNGTTLRDLVNTTFSGCDAAMYQYEQQFYPTTTSTKADFDAYIAEVKANPKHTLEGVVYYPSEKIAKDKVIALNGTVVNGKVLSVTLREN